MCFCIGAFFHSSAVGVSPRFLLLLFSIYKICAFHAVKMETYLVCNIRLLLKRFDTRATECWLWLPIYAGLMTKCDEYWTAWDFHANIRKDLLWLACIIYGIWLWGGSCHDQLSAGSSIESHRCRFNIYQLERFTFLLQDLRLHLQRLLVFWWIMYKSNIFWCFACLIFLRCFATFTAATRNTQTHASTHIWPIIQQRIIWMEARNGWRSFNRNLISAQWIDIMVNRIRILRPCLVVSRGVVSNQPPNQADSQGSALSVADFGERTYTKDGLSLF